MSALLSPPDARHFSAAPQAEEAFPSFEDFHGEPILDDAIRDLLPGHSPEEKDALEREIAHDGVCLAALVVWKETHKLLDGYTRLEICPRRGIAYRMVALSFSSLAAARDWVLAQQTGHRNLTDNGQSYVRGKRYLEAKQAHGGQKPREKWSDHTDHSVSGNEDGKRLEGDVSALWSGHNDSQKTADILARVYGLTEKTIRRDGDYAAAVDKIVAACGHWAKAMLVSPGAKVPRKRAMLLAEMGPGDQRQLMEHVKAGRELPWGKQPAPAFMRLPLETDGLVAVLRDRLGHERLVEIHRRIGEVLDAKNETPDTA